MQVDKLMQADKLMQVDKQMQVDKLMQADKLMQVDKQMQVNKLMYLQIDSYVLIIVQMSLESIYKFIYSQNIFCKKYKNWLYNKFDI